MKISTKMTSFVDPDGWKTESYFNCCRILYIHDVTSILSDLHVESYMPCLVMSTKDSKSNKKQGI
jgi:hypothetical protein